MSVKRLVFSGFDISGVLELYEAGALPMVTLWLSNRCDLNCIYCATEAGQTPDKGELELYELKDLIVQCRDLGARFAVINGKGEPLMDPRAWEMFDYIREQNMALTLVTNGILINTREKARFLFEHQVSVEVKLHHLDANVHDYLVGRQGAHKLAVQALNHLLEVGYATVREIDNCLETQLAVEVLLVKPALEGIPDLMRFCKENNIYISLDDFIPCGRGCDVGIVQELAVNYEERQWLCQEYKRIMGYPHYGTENWQCPIRIGLFIDNVGNVRADESGSSCDIYFTPNFANVREESVGSIWEKLLALRASRRFVLWELTQEKEAIMPCPKMREAQRKWEAEHRFGIWQQDYLVQNPN